jgi:hypothetical protein
MKYYEALVKQVLEIPTTRGTKSKVLRDRLLIEGEGITYVEAKVNEMMKDNPNEWEITSIKESRIVEVVLSK